MAFTLSDDEKIFLLKSARRSIKLFLQGKQVNSTNYYSENLQTKCGVFVTHHKNNDLRGCIGYVEGIKPMQDAVMDLAISAAVNDPRFMPITLEELPNIDIEISVLTPLTQVFDPSEISIGSDGLLIKKGIYQGLLLPQVAAERKWNVETFLKQTCNKAGLSPDAWQEKDVEIYKFSAIIFNEKLFEQHIRKH
ncbi:MAG: AmmeMemoRadiSam system protein A [Caldithrix sp.]|nr:AmmeMemoRadiSam system protein A [Caldithrix sp.]